MLSLVAVDQDPDAIKVLHERLDSFDNVTIVQNNFSNVKDILKEQGIEKIDGMLLDLGVSSFQLDVRLRKTPRVLGTVNAAGAAGLHAAIEYINSIGFEVIEAREAALTKLAFDAMQNIPGVHIIGGKTSEEHKGILTFTVEGVHPHDIAAILDADGVNIRAGNHCAQPLLDHLCTGATARASLAFYNSAADVERFINSLSTIRERMGYGR